MNTLSYFKDHLDDYLSELRELVEIESPTRDLAGLTRAADFLTGCLSPLAEVTTENLDGLGPMLRARRHSSGHEPTGPRLILLAHYDTVWPVASWPELWRPAGGRMRPALHPLAAPVSGRERQRPPRHRDPAQPRRGGGLARLDARDP